MVSSRLLSIGVYVTSLLTVEGLDFTPDELHAHLPLEHRLVHEGQRAEVVRVDEGTQDARSVLEVLLRIDQGDFVVVAHVASNDKAGKATTNNQHAALGHF